MLKWAVTSRSNDEFDQDECLTFEKIIEQQKFPCLVRIDNNDSLENYLILLCETNEPYLSVSNETKQFAIPILFDGLFALVEHGITRYNVLQSIHSLLPHLKLSYTHFTTLKSYTVHHNSLSCHLDPGTLLELCHKPTTTSTVRLRTLFTSLPHSLNKHLLLNHQTKFSIKKQFSSNEHFQVKSNVHPDILTLKSDSKGIFVPVYSQFPSVSSLNSFSYLSNPIQGLYTIQFLSELTNHYPLIVELIISRSLEQHTSTTLGYPFRRITVHRFVENHRRIVAYDMKNNSFIELDLQHRLNLYVVKHPTHQSQHYQTQLRWCQKYLPSFRSQIKTIHRSINETMMFIQTTQFTKRRSQDYHQRRNSSSVIKSTPKMFYNSQDSISTMNFQLQNHLASKFFTISNDSKYQQNPRKNARVHFNESTIERYSQMKKYSKREKTEKTEENDDIFQCTAL
ncbi:unnamed protein product [Adineta ricciae]|uniref:Uncharacterized protein n=1 Tax=Adineta ricciae TaxID=249248 RepID=A0A815L394_ADIRI|nr:unnamed protein product [Adineta ricciae]